MLDVCEEYSAKNNILFSTHPLSKTKCIFMTGKAKNLVKPVPLTLWWRDLPLVECASHLGHTLHESGTMDQDARVARAKLIDQLVDIQHSFPLPSLWRF